MRSLFIYLFIIIFVRQIFGQNDSTVYKSRKTTFDVGIGCIINTLKRDNNFPYTFRPSHDNPSGEEYIYKNSFGFLTRFIPFCEAGITVNRIKNTIAFGTNYGTDNHAFGHSGNEELNLHQFLYSYQMDYIFISKKEKKFHVVPVLSIEIFDIRNNLKSNTNDADNEAFITTNFSDRINLFSVQLKPGIQLVYKDFNLRLYIGLNLISEIQGKFFWKYTWSKPGFTSFEENIEKKYNHFLNTYDNIKNGYFFNQVGFKLYYSFNMKCKK